MGGERYHVQKPLGRGPEGASFLGVDSATGQSVTIERVVLENVTHERIQWLEERISWMQQEQPQGVLELLHHKRDDRALVLVKAHAEHQLNTAPPLQAPGANDSPKARAEQLVRQVGGALLNAHRHGIGHGSIHPGRMHWVSERWCLDTLPVQTYHPSETEALRERLYMAPEGGHRRSADVYAFGACLLHVMSASRLSAPSWDRQPCAELPTPWSTWLEQMLRVSPWERPSLDHVLNKLLEQAAEPENTRRIAASAPEPEPPMAGTRIGRFRVLRTLGSGANGCVFLVDDLLTGVPCALKTLLPSALNDPEGRSRFHRESELLAHINSPYVSRFIDANQVGGVHYLAMEFLAGESLAQQLHSTGAFAVNDALGIARDIAGGLRDLHKHNIIHRDVKPANIILAEGNSTAPAKLCDLGIAYKQFSSKDSHLTGIGMTVGTPHYMSPEQCGLSRVDARSDLYSLGVVLFAMLSGCLPFPGDDPMAVIHKKLHTNPPSLVTLRPNLGTRVVALVEKLMQRDPSERFASATVLVEELNCILHGKPTTTDVRPRTLGGDQRPKIFTFELELASSPAELWPLVSDTDRLNQAIKLSAVTYSRNENKIQAEQHQVGTHLLWTEHPFEWLAPRRLGVLREFQHGPVAWLRNIVTLSPRDEGTLLTHRIEAMPRNIAGSFIIMNELALRVRPRLITTYRHIDDFVQHGRRTRTPAETPEAAARDPFVKPHKPTRREQKAIEAACTALLQSGADPKIVHALFAYIAMAPAQRLARIRSKQLASQLGFKHRDVLSICLQAASQGSLELRWDIICPSCQTGSSQQDNLVNLEAHQDCPGCGSSFELNLADSVELIFRPEASIRQSELRTFCIGGPAHTPHVLAQLNMQAGERIALPMRLQAGKYRLAARELAEAWIFAVSDRATERVAEFSLRQGMLGRGQRTLASMQQHITVRNDHDSPLLIRIESAHEREHSLSAAEASHHPDFRRLFPDQLLRPEQLLQAGKVFLLTISWNEFWTSQDTDGQAFAQMLKLKEELETAFLPYSGTVVFFDSEQMLFRFLDAKSTFECALLLRQLKSRTLRAAAHCGTALMTNSGQGLNLFGRVLREQSCFLAASKPDELVMSEALWSSADVSQQEAAASLHAGVLSLGQTVGHRLALSDPTPGVFEARPEAQGNQ